ncbi:uracil-DNA glycosylase family protein [bacterium]|nr:uracil-DNA glycosylase family protein [bacterium]
MATPPHRPARPSRRALAALLGEIRVCRLCAEALPHGPRPVVQADAAARILVVGQAPGRKVHESGKPFDDVSGDVLRDWMGVDRDTFYDPAKLAIVPMGFCYPGTGKGGDLPPRPECAPAWRAPLLAQLPRIELTLVIGRYALDWHLGARGRPVAEVVRAWRDTAPGLIPTPHPSPRNRLWLRKNPWFEAEVVPWIRERVAALLD